jgi:magnesium transporter
MTTEAPIPLPDPAPGDPQTAGPPAASVSTAQPPRCPTRTRMYQSGRLLAEGFPAEEISDRLAGQPDGVVWLDLYEPTEADLQIVVEEFGLHPLAVEDAIQPHQRAKVDRYNSHLFANMYVPGVDEHGDAPTALTTGEISVFVTPRALITVRKNEFDIDALISQWDLNTQLVSSTNAVSFLLYGLFDAVVDGHYRAVEKLDVAIDDLQTYLFNPVRGVDIRRRGYDLGASVAALRRIVAPMPELIGRLMRTDTHLVEDTLIAYYRDVHDHALRALETLDAARERLSSTLQAHLNEQGAQLNEITKKLAAWAAIIAVPTAITGYYGQNVPYPGFGHLSGFLTSTLVMIILAGGLYVLLRRSHWL